MAIYATPNVTDTQDIFSMFRFVNDTATAGLFMPIMVLVIWVIAFIGSLVEGRQAVVAWVFASFVGVILGILAGIMGMLDRQWIYLLILLIAGGIFWMKLQSAKLS